MKKFIWFMAIMIVFAFSGTALAAPKHVTFYLNTAEDDLSAVTCAPVGSVSPMIVQGMNYKRSDKATVISLDGFSGGLATFAINGTTMSQYAVVKGSTPFGIAGNAGSTFFLTVAVSMKEEDILKVDRIPLFYGTALSGDTKTPRTVVLPKGGFMSVLWGAGNGNSLYSGSTVDMIIDIPEDQNWSPPQAIELGKMTWRLTVTTGVSTLATDSDGKTLPLGTKWVELMARTISGVSLIYEPRGDLNTPSTTESPSVDAGEKVWVEGDIETIKRWAMRVCAPTVIVGRCCSRNPYLKP